MRRYKESLAKRLPWRPTEVCNALLKSEILGLTVGRSMSPQAIRSLVTTIQPIELAQLPLECDASLLSAIGIVPNLCWKKPSHQRMLSQTYCSIRLPTTQATVGN